MVCLLAGGGATLFISQKLLPSWAASGEGGGPFRPFTVSLPKGEHYVYYQSAASVPTPDQLRITIMSSVGENIRLRRIPDEDLEEHTFAIGDAQGRALFIMQITDADDYSVEVNWITASQDKNDQIIFKKEPPTFSEAKTQRATIMIVGLGVTLVLFILLYVVHGIKLSRRNAAPPPPRFGLGEPLV